MGNCCGYKSEQKKTDISQFENALNDQPVPENKISENDKSKKEKQGKVVKGKNVPPPRPPSDDPISQFESQPFTNEEMDKCEESIFKDYEGDHKSKIANGIFNWDELFIIYKDSLDRAFDLFMNRRNAMSVARRKLLKEGQLSDYAHMIALQ